MFKLSKLILFLFLAFPSSLTAQHAIILHLGGGLHSVDLQSGETTFIGSTGFSGSGYYWTSLAIDSQGRLFSTYGDWRTTYDIYEINPATGQATFVSHTNLSGIVGLAFDNNDVLHALNDQNPPHARQQMDFYSIDLNSGVETFINDTGIHYAGSLEYYDGSFWTYNTWNGLHKIDAATGIASDVNNRFRGPFPGYTTVCISESGTFYHLNDFIWMMDEHTGTFSLVNPITPNRPWGGSVFIEGPKDPFSLWLAGVTDGPITIIVSGATPFGQVAISSSRGTGGPTLIPFGFPCAGLEMDLGPFMQVVGIVTANANGKAILGPRFTPPGAVLKRRFQAVDLSTCEKSNRVIVAY